MDTNPKNSNVSKHQNKFNFDKKSLLGFISITIAFITLIATIYIPISQNKKDLKIFTISQTPLAKIDRKYKSKLEIIYDGKKIKEAFVSVIQIYNSGNKPIESEDFKRPISFNFDKKTQLIDADIIDTQPKGVNPKLSIENNQVTLQKTLINSQDKINIYFITTTTKNPKIDTRISGVSNIKIEENKDKTKSYITLFASIYFMSVGSLISWASISFFRKPKKRIWVFVSCFTVFIALAYYLFIF